MGQSDRKGVMPDRGEDFLSLFTPSIPVIRAYIGMYLSHSADVDDVFQQTSIVLWRKFPTFEPGTSFHSWACQVAAFEIRNFLRSQSRSRQVLSEETVRAIADQHSRQPDRLAIIARAVETCLSRLSADDSDFVRRCYHAQKSIKEVAEESGRHVDAIYSRLKRLRQVLRLCLDKQLQEAAQ